MTFCAFFAHFTLLQYRRKNFNLAATYSSSLHFFDGWDGRICNRSPRAVRERARSHRRAAFSLIKIKPFCFAFPLFAFPATCVAASPTNRTSQKAHPFGRAFGWDGRI